MQFIDDGYVLPPLGLCALGASISSEGYGEGDCE